MGKVFAESSPVFETEEIAKREEKVHSMICVPLENSYETLGCIQYISRRDGKAFTDEDADVCQIMANSF